MSAALIIPLELAVSEIITRPPERILEERVNGIDGSVSALELAVTEKDWNAIWVRTGWLHGEIDNLIHLGAAAEFRVQLNAAKRCLERAEEAIPKQDLSRLQAELREFRKLYAPVHDAPMKPGPKPPTRN
jgi:hypothetical protein